MSTYGTNRGERNAKPKFSALDINSLHRISRSESHGRTVQRDTLPRKNGMQTLGKVPSARRPPTNLPSLKSETASPSEQQGKLSPLTISGRASSSLTPSSEAMRKQKIASGANMNNTSPSNVLTPINGNQIYSSGSPSWSTVATSGLQLVTTPPPIYQNEFPSLNLAAVSLNNNCPSPTVALKGENQSPQVTPNSQKSQRSSSPEALPPQFRALMPQFVYRTGGSGGTGGCYLRSNDSRAKYNVNQYSPVPQRRSIPMYNNNWKQNDEHRRLSYQEGEVQTQRPIIREEELERIESIAKEEGWSRNDVIDYNQKLLSSEDEGVETFSPAFDTSRGDYPIKMEHSKNDERKEQGTSRASVQCKETIPEVNEKEKVIPTINREHDPTVYSQQSRKLDAEAVGRHKQRQEEADKLEEQRKQAAARKLHELELRIQKKFEIEDFSSPLITPASPKECVKDKMNFLNHMDSKAADSFEDSNKIERNDNDSSTSRDVLPTFSKSFKTNMPPRFMKQRLERMQSQAKSSNNKSSNRNPKETASGSLSQQHQPHFIYQGSQEHNKQQPNQRNKCDDLVLRRCRLDSKDEDHNSSEHASINRTTVSGTQTTFTNRIDSESSQRRSSISSEDDVIESWADELEGEFRKQIERKKIVSEEPKFILKRNEEILPRYDSTAVAELPPVSECGTNLNSKSQLLDQTKMEYKPDEVVLEQVKSSLLVTPEVWKNSEAAYDSSSVVLTQPLNIVTTNVPRIPMEEAIVPVPDAGRGTRASPLINHCPVTNKFNLVQNTATGSRFNAWRPSLSSRDDKPSYGSFRGGKPGRFSSGNIRIDNYGPPSCRRPFRGNDNKGDKPRDEDRNQLNQVVPDGARFANSEYHKESNGGNKPNVNSQWSVQKELGVSESNSQGKGSSSYTNKPPDTREDRNNSAGAVPMRPNAWEKPLKSLGNQREDNPVVHPMILGEMTELATRFSKNRVLRPPKLLEPQKLQQHKHDNGADNSESNNELPGGGAMPVNTIIFQNTNFKMSSPHQGFIPISNQQLQPSNSSQPCQPLGGDPFLTASAAELISDNSSYGSENEVNSSQLQFLNADEVATTLPPLRNNYIYDARNIITEDAGNVFNAERFLGVPGTQDGDALAANTQSLALKQVDEMLGTSSNVCKVKPTQQQIQQSGLSLPSQGEPRNAMSATAPSYFPPSEYPVMSALPSPPAPVVLNSPQPRLYKTFLMETNQPSFAGYPNPYADVDPYSTFLAPQNLSNPTPYQHISSQYQLRNVPTFNPAQQVSNPSSGLVFSSVAAMKGTGMKSAASNARFGQQYMGMYSQQHTSSLQNNNHYTTSGGTGTAPKTNPGSHYAASGGVQNYGLPGPLFPEHAMPNNTHIRPTQPAANPNFRTPYLNAAMSQPYGGETTSGSYIKSNTGLPQPRFDQWNLQNLQHQNLYQQQQQQQQQYQHQQHQQHQHLSGAQFPSGGGEAQHYPGPIQRPN